MTMTTTTCNDSIRPIRLTVTLGLKTNRRGDLVLVSLPQTDTQTNTAHTQMPRDHYLVFVPVLSFAPLHTHPTPRPAERLSPCPCLCSEFCPPPHLHHTHNAKRSSPCPCLCSAFCPSPQPLCRWTSCISRPDLCHCASPAIPPETQNGKLLGGTAKKGQTTCRVRRVVVVGGGRSLQKWMRGTTSLQ